MYSRICPQAVFPGKGPARFDGGRDSLYSNAGNALPADLHEKVYIYRKGDIMAISGVSNHSYNYYDYSKLDSTSWEQNAKDQADKITSSVTGTSSTKSTTASSASGFLMGYQTRLEDVESSAAKLQMFAKDNVFQKYDEALRNAAAAPDDKAAADKVDKAVDDIVAAAKDFTSKINSTLSYLKNNTGLGSGVSAQLDTFKRSLPTDKTLKALGMGYDTNGNLTFDEDALREAIENDPDEVKELLGGQFGLAERVGSKATKILDSSVNSIMGGTSSSSNTSSTDKTNTTGSTNSTSTGTSSKSSSTSDSFKQFASFARSGAYNLSNYYAVSMLNILV